MPPGGMPPAEVDLTVDQVRRLLATQASDFAGWDITPLAEGWDNFLFRLGDRWLGRFPRREVAVELLRNETRWLPVLAPRLTLPVPVPELVGEPGEGYPWPWTITPWIPGVPLAEDPNLDQPRGVGDLGSFLRGLHQPAPPEAPPNPFNHGVSLGDRDEATRNRLAELEALVEPDAVLACWEDALEAPRHGGAPVWLHGDLHPGNLIVEGGRISGVVDFGDITAGDPATDLSAAWTLFGGEHRHRFQAAYGEIDDATWRRARGWALSLGLAYLASSADNPVIGDIGKRTLRAPGSDGMRSRAAQAPGGTGMGLPLQSMPSAGR